MPVSRSVVRHVLLGSMGLPFLATAVPLGATTFVPQAMTCPIGGEEFRADVVASNSYLGQRPDGRPYSPMPVVPIPECPGNGLILFDEDFSHEHLARLADAIALPEYAALRQQHVQFYRLAWLQGQIDADPYDIATSLMVAGWQVDDNADLKRRYQGEFVTAIAALDPAASQGDAWFWLGMRAANALREIGRFQEAAALLESLAGSPYMPQDADDREGALFLSAQLAKLVAEGNAHAEPTNLVPPEYAAARCMAADAGLSAVEREACETEELREAIAELREYEQEDNG
jgi:hypothetical protein